MSGSNRALSLDGIRGIALICPLAVHLKLAGMGNGLWLSIGMFFTLSGFLITSLALREIDRTGGVSILGFYARRLRRLMPGAILVLTLIVVVAWAMDWPAMAAVRDDVLAAFTWRANWEQMQGGGYWAVGVPSLTLHFWSLSLEEQVYLVFPLLLAGVALLARATRPAVRIAWLMGALTAVSWLMLFRTDEASHLYLSTWTRMGEATFGCLVAALSHLWPARRSDRVMGWLTIGLMAAIAPLWTLAVGDEAWGIRTGILLATPLTGLVIALLWRHPGSLPSRVFSMRVPAWLGRRSYGIYLLHLPIMDLLAHQLGLSPDERLPYRWMVVAVAATIAAAGLMFAVVEEPIRVAHFARGPSRFTALIAAGSVLLVAVTYQLGVGGLGVDVPDSSSASVLDDVVFTLPPPTAPGDPAVLNNPPPTGEFRVMVIGDSNAWIISGALDLSMPSVNWNTGAMWMVGCAPGGDARMMATVKGDSLLVREIGDEEGCDQWWNDLLPRALLSFEPNVVLEVGGHALSYEVDPEADDRWCQLGDGSGRCEQWAAARLRAVNERVLTYAPDAHLVMTTVAPADPWGPLDLPEAVFDDLNRLIRAEAERIGASLIDLGSWINDHDELIVDGVHLGNEGVQTVAPWLRDELLAVVAGQRAAVGSG